jgi:hypothetical protein
MKKKFLNRIILWSIERFPPIQILTAFLTFAIVCLPLTQSGLPVLFSSGTFIVFSILLTLRVIDEHKDYSSDQIAHPERLLQKQVLSLSDLRKVAYFFSALSGLIVIVSYLNTAVIVALSLLLIWGFLMTKEFFVHNWLSKKLIIYSISHLLISPFLIYFCAAIAGTQDNEKIVSMMMVSFFCAFSYEVARKIKGHDEENLNESNYINSYGVTKSLVLWVIVSILAIVASTTMVDVNPVKLYFYLGTVFYVLLSAFLFYKHPVKKYRKLNEAAAGMVGLISFVVPLAQIIYA